MISQSKIRAYKKIENRLSGPEEDSRDRADGKERYEERRGQEMRKIIPQRLS